MHSRGSRAARRRRTAGLRLGEPGSDRLESVGRWVCLLLLLATVPIAVLVATTVGTRLGATAHEQAAQRHPVAATLVADVPVTATADTEIPRPVLAPVTWQERGTLHTGRARVLPGTKAGTPVRVWVDRRGRVTPPPLDGATVSAAAVIAGLTALCVVGTTALVGRRAFGGLAERRRMRALELEWAIVEPRWSGKVP